MTCRRSSGPLCQEWQLQCQGPFSWVCMHPGLSPRTGWGDLSPRVGVHSWVKENPKSLSNSHTWGSHSLSLYVSILPDPFLFLRPCCPLPSPQVFPVLSLGAIPCIEPLDLLNCILVTHTAWCVLS